MSDRGHPGVDRPAGVRRRALLRGGAAAGALLGLAACGTEAQPTEPPTQPAQPTQPPAEPPGPATALGPPPLTRTSPPPAAPSNGGPAVELVRAATGRPEVALTFHGDSDLTLDRAILEALATGGAHVTVLAVGTWLAKYPDAARIVTDLGHELGNHTWSHRTMNRLSVAAQRDEIVRCRDRIAELTGGPGAFFRQSAARRATTEQLELAGAAGYPRALSYDIDSLDWTDPGPATVRTQLRKATAGSVVSMHLGHRGTLAAIPDILADLDRRGLKAVTAGRLFTA